MKILITGGRTYNDRVYVYKILDQILSKRDISLIIHGGANGADKLADEWAKLREIPCLRHPAKWKTGSNGNREGPIRNSAMLQWKPNLAIAFPGNNGTADMVRKIVKNGIKILDLR